MNKTIRIRRTIRMLQKPSLLMDYSQHNSFTVCQCCNEPANHYTYIPVLGNIFVCDSCKVKWDRWGLPLFKEMIGFE